jgi:hypothetical protein
MTENGLTLNASAAYIADKQNIFITEDFVEVAPVPFSDRIAEKVSQWLAMGREPGPPPSLLPAGVALIALNCEQDVDIGEDEAGGAQERAQR